MDFLLNEDFKASEATDEGNFEIEVTDIGSMTIQIGGNEHQDMDVRIAEVSSAYIAEKMNQDPPTIIQNGYDDGEPVSPNIKKNTVLGALCGAVFSIIIIVVSYLFNDTIIDAEDIDKKLGMNVLGTLPLEEMEDGSNIGKKTKRTRKK